MSGDLLLDTCAALWSVEPDRRFASTGRPEVARAIDAGARVLVSPISAWEIGMLVSRGRLALRLDPSAWFDGLIEDGIELAELEPGTLVQASFLPHCPLRDPADKIIAATARARDCTVVTRDAALLGYAKGGWIKALAC